MVSFEPSSIYGSRVGFHEILLVTAADKQTLFHRSPLWKQLVVPGVSMLSRANMAKPPRGDNKFGGEPRFTRVQEMKQAGVVSLIDSSSWSKFFVLSPLIIYNSSWSPVLWWLQLHRQDLRGAHADRDAKRCDGPAGL